VVGGREGERREWEKGEEARYEDSSNKDFTCINYTMDEMI